jgi:Rho guanine nucleotide exchange factor 4
MANIPLEGFLLTPVQKICKYPVQLKELLRHTEVHHSDYSQLQVALDATRWTAALINERKRKVDSLEMLLSWQDTVADWQVR